jgi:hypothetical protein
LTELIYFCTESDEVRCPFLSLFFCHPTIVLLGICLDRQVS